MNSATKATTNLSVLDVKGFIQRGLEHFNHLLVFKVVDDVLQDLAVRLAAEGAEQHDNGHFLGREAGAKMANKERRTEG